MKISEIAFTTYAATDLSRARKFYEEILGLKASSVWEGDSMGFIEYEIGTQTLAIGKGAPQFSPGRIGATVALEVTDFLATIETLKKNDVVFLLQPHETPVCHMAVIEDSEGNQLMIHQRKQK